MNRKYMTGLFATVGLLALLSAWLVQNMSYEPARADLSEIRSIYLMETFATAEKLGDLEVLISQTLLAVEENKSLEIPAPDVQFVIRFVSLGTANFAAWIEIQSASVNKIISRFGNEEDLLQARKISTDVAGKIEQIHDIEMQLGTVSLDDALEFAFEVVSIHLTQAEDLMAELASIQDSIEDRVTKRGERSKKWYFSLYVVGSFFIVAAGITRVAIDRPPRPVPGE